MPDPSTSVSAYRRGVLDAKVGPRIAIAHLCDPREGNPISIIGFNVPGVPDTSFAAPLALSEFVEPCDEPNQHLFLMPQYCHTNLHIDTIDIVAALIGPCVKLWVCFLPSPRNLPRMSSTNGQRAKPAKIGPKLEGGIIFTTASDESVYLPVGLPPFCLYSRRRIPRHK
jgi:hypothetical protein